MVSSHGWPLSADAFEDQICFLATAAIAVSRMTAAVMAVQANRGKAMT